MDGNGGAEEPEDWDSMRWCGWSIVIIIYIMIGISNNKVIYIYIYIVKII